LTAWLAAVALVALVTILAVFRAVVALSQRTGAARNELAESGRRLAEAERIIDRLAEAPPDDPALLDSWRDRMRDRDGAPRD
jgi:hypothetical protein